MISDSVIKFRLAFAVLWQCGYCGQVYATSLEQPADEVNNKFRCHTCEMLDRMDEEVLRGNGNCSS